MEVGMGEPEMNSASVGPIGERVRSDLNVSYEPTADPLTIDRISKVDYLYGEAIETAVRRDLAGRERVVMGRARAGTPAH